MAGQVKFTLYSLFCSALAGASASICAGICDTLPVVTENEKDDLVPGRPYFEAFSLPGTPQNVTLGPNPVEEHTGIFQVTVVWPFGNAWGKPTRLADAVADFFRGKKLTNNAGASVQVLGAWAGAGFQDGRWYRVPVSIRYRTFLVQ